MSTAINDSVSLYYETFGDRERNDAVVLLHGAGSDHTLWRSQIDALQHRFYVIAVDLRGSGQSDRPEGPYTADQMVDDVLAVVDAEGLSSVNLVGYSLGGLIAQKLAGRHPQKVRRLGLLNCSLGAGVSDTVLPVAEVVNMFLFSPVLTDEDCCRNAVDYSFGKQFEIDSPDAYRAFFDYTYRNKEGMPGQIAVVVSRERIIEDFERITMPVMVVLSTDDPVTPPANGAVFRQYLPHARIEYLDGYHASMLIHPIEVSTLLEDFLSNS